MLQRARGLFAFALICTLLTCTARLWAQVDRVTITGTITDSSRAVIPAASIVATNSSNGVQYRGISNQEGLYTLLDLPIGEYSLRVERQGFSSMTQDHINLLVGQKIGINFTLHVGQASQTVAVTTTAPIFDLGQSEGTNITNRVATDLPLNINGGRTISGFAFAVTPTVTGTDWQTHVAGSQAFTRENLIDGTVADSGVVGDIGETSPSMDAVQQFAVDTAGITAEAGRTGGGAFDFELKSGTNQLHGSVFGFYADQLLNANTWDNKFVLASLGPENPSNVAQYAANERQPYGYKDYGVSAGGPLWKNHMFIFGALEKYNQSEFGATDGNVTVPTTAFLNGDFSAILQTNAAPLGKDNAGNEIYPGAIYDPDTGNVFPGNIIPRGRISPISQKILDIYKKNYAPTIAGNTLNNYPGLNSKTPQFDQTQLSFKYDWALTDKNRVSASYLYVLRPRILLNDLSIPWQAGSRNGGPLTQARQQTTMANQYRANDLYTFTPSLINSVSLDFNSFANRNTSETAYQGSTWPSQLGLGSYGQVKNFPNINFQGTVNGQYESTIGSTAVGGYVAYNEELTDTLTWLKGRHTIKFGTEDIGLGINDDIVGGPLTLNFNHLSGAPSSGKQSAHIQSVTGFAFANFELGDVYSASEQTPLDQDGRRKEYAFYAEDNFKATKKLTVDGAIRWDIPMPMHVRNGYWSNFDATYQNPNFGSYQGSVVYLPHPGASFETIKNLHQFAPHIGASYLALKNLVVHGSYGLYYVPMGNNMYTGAPFGSAIGFQATNQITPPTAPTSYQFNWDQQGYPGQDVLPTRSDNNTFIPKGVASIDPNSLTLGYTQNWNVGAEYEFPHEVVVKVSYIGNRGADLHDGTLNPYNFPTWQAYQQLLNSGNLQAKVKDAASAAAAGVPYPYVGWTGSAYMALNPYPQVAVTGGGIYFVNSPLGASRYSAFVVEVVKAESSGLSLDLSYTGSRATGNTETAMLQASTGAGFQNPYNYKQYASRPVSYDIPHQIKGYADYELPVGPGQRFLANNRVYGNIIGGWHISVIVNYQMEGGPFSAIHVQNANGYTGWSAVYTDVVTNPNLHRLFRTANPLWQPANGPDPNSLFVDPTSFSAPTTGALGNSPRYFNSWHGFGWENEDLAVHKDIAFGKDLRYRLELRGEFFDAFNRHHWSSPNMTFGSPYFGHVQNATADTRTGQVGARIDF